MIVAEILADLAQQGVQLWAEDGRLRYRAPKGVLTPMLRAMLTEHKGEIFALLRQHPAEAQSLYPLSYGQQSLWFLRQIAPESAAYHVAFTAQICSAVDVPALQRAFQALVNRHTALRATYAMRDGKLVQQVHAHMEVSFEETDASTWSWNVLNARVLKAYQRPFDLERGPTLRVNLFTQSVQNHVLLLTSHHIATDGWSLWVMLDELRTLYHAEHSNTPASLPLLSLQYTDYVRWQTNMLAGPEGERLWAYWEKQLAGALPVLNLPTDRPRPPVQAYRGASRTFRLNQMLTRQLKALAKTEEVTLYVMLLAAFQSLLYRYTDQEDIIVGSPVFGRDRAEFAGIVGHFINMVTLRADFSGNPTFKAFLRQVRHTFLNAIKHHEYPFSLLIERLQLVRTSSYSPLVQVMFTLQKPHRSEMLAEFFIPAETHTQVEFGGLTLRPFFIPQQEGQFDLTLNMGEVNESLFGSLMYNTDLFEASTIDRMLGHFQTLLESIVANPEQRLSDLPLLTEEDQYRLLVEWNDTKSDYPEHMCIHQLFEEQVRQTPEAVAVVFEGEKLTYSELNRRANALAYALQALGVGPEALVGVCMERSLEMVIALLGILKAGGAYVPLDPIYPRERLDYMVQDAQMSILLTQTRLLELLPKDGIRLICLDSDWKASEQEENLVSNVQPDNPVYMIYTSGSTGRPKGVMNIHRGLSNRLHWMQQAYQLTPADRVLQKTPFSFDVSAWEFFWPLLTGACLVVARPGGHWDPAYLVSLMAEEQITTLHFVPSMLQAFLMASGLERCTSLKRVICSGEALPFELQERFFSRFESELHHTVELHNLYGPTEASIDVTYWQCRPGSHVPIGRPIANTQMYILDRAWHPVPIGVAGELYIGGIGVARGYFNRPELTAEKFVPDPFRKEAGARLFKTGDLARYRADGAIEFLGRIDHQAKIRGFRIELGEIEVVLAQHPAIKEVLIVAREDMPGNKRLVAYLVRKLGIAELSVEELRNFLKEKLPRYMIPAAFVFLDALPLMPNGKVNRKALPRPDMRRPQLEKAFVAPRTPVEELLARIWADVLGIDKVGIQDNFFDLGGASIQGLQIITKAHEAGLHLTPEMLFEHKAIAELAAVAGTIQPVQASTNRRDAVDTPETAVAATQRQTQTARGNTIIESIGVYLPPKVVSTKEVLENCCKPVNFPLEQLTGINTRRMAGETEFSIDLAKKAVENCLANSKHEPGDIDLVICSNISRCDGPNFQVSFEPSTAMRLKAQFGFSNAVVFDISNACTGMFTAVLLIDAFIKAGWIRRGMVVSGEYITHLTRTAQKEIESYLDSRLACLTVGDAGAAVILEEGPDNKVGFHEIEFYTLGRYYDLCIARATDKEHGGAIMYTDSVRIASLNIQQAVAHAAYVLERSGWSPEAFQHVIMHQTSKMTLNDAAREINSFFRREICHEDNVIHNLAERGNTATTTHVVALMDHIISNHIRSGENVIFGITGSGATIGTALYTFDDLPDRLHQMESHGQRPDKVELKAAQRTAVPSSLPTVSSCKIRVESIGIPSEGTQVKREALTLAQAAARDCLERSSYSRSDIDLLIYAGVYRDEFLCEPALASMVAGELKINDTIESQRDKKTFAFDLFNGALGFLNACYVGAGMIQAQKMKCVMVVAAEIENNWETFPTELRGLKETGSALILDESVDGKTGFGNFVFRYFSDYVNAFKAYTVVQQGGKICMRFEKDPGLETYYLQCISDAVRELLNIEQLDLSQVRVVLPPQISSTFITELSNEMNVSRDRFVDVAHDGYDLFTSSVPHVLRHVREQNLVQPGDIGLIIAVGTGIQVGCATYYF
jgi:amino acid adenylation domain-containing protein